VPRRDLSGGYVANVSETADWVTDVQLMTDVHVEPNRADDTALMEQSLDDQVRRGNGVNRVMGDGGFTGSVPVWLAAHLLVLLVRVRVVGDLSPQPVACK